jgi:hypothetical protein
LLQMRRWERCCWIFGLILRFDWKRYEKSW